MQIDFTHDAYHGDAAVVWYDENDVRHEVEDAVLYNLDGRLVIIMPPNENKIHEIVVKPKKQ